MTVQVLEKVFGFIEICELSDDISGRVIDEVLQNQPIFTARVIGFEKNDKPVLSARASVVNEESWELINPTGKSANFQKYDEKNQKIGNQRNKILKYGA